MSATASDSCALYITYLLQIIAARASKGLPNWLDAVDKCLQHKYIVDGLLGVQEVDFRRHDHELVIASQ